MNGRCIARHVRIRPTSVTGLGCTKHEGGRFPPVRGEECFRIIEAESPGRSPEAVPLVQVRRHMRLDEIVEGVRVQDLIQALVGRMPARLLRSGVDIVTISQWLGHVSITTTNRYATVDLETKRKAIEQARPVNDVDSSVALWRTDASVLTWLEAL
jgi:hypothetical protein